MNQITCPHCGEKSVAKTKSKMDGFKIIGTIQICALCGAELAEATAEKNAGPDTEAANRFAALLGEGAAPEEKADLAPDESYGRFCRNCAHFIEHPFKTLCGVNGTAADPMGECAKFEKKQ